MPHSISLLRNLAIICPPSHQQLLPKTESETLNHAVKLKGALPRWPETRGEPAPGVFAIRVAQTATVLSKWAPLSRILEPPESHSGCGHHVAPAPCRSDSAPRLQGPDPGSRMLLQLSTSETQKSRTHAAHGGRVGGSSSKITRDPSCCCQKTHVLDHRGARHETMSGAPRAWTQRAPTHHSNQLTKEAGGSDSHAPAGGREKIHLAGNVRFGVF